jgi:hypothetical protein
MQYSKRNFIKEKFMDGPNKVAMFACGSVMISCISWAAIMITVASLSAWQGLLVVFISYVAYKNVVELAIFMYRIRFSQWLRLNSSRFGVSHEMLYEDFLGGSKINAFLAHDQVIDDHIVKWKTIVFTNLMTRRSGGILDRVRYTTKATWLT